ncbi:CesT family type III secretion system chaperone [Chitinivorax sp. B]|uniref:CesT family type III secretion system chaperone n=1 Tax=Chitinivorax sp. B TaxID=2502235 RepID=UPI0010F4AB6E|nr:CesT family type III secretion system chaperone [Chitinivorax sp. B]
MNSMMMVMRDLGHRLGLVLDLTRGAVALTDVDGQVWQIEPDEVGGNLLIHCQLVPWHAGRGDERQLAHWMSVNADVARMKGAWLALQRDQGRIALYMLIPAALLTATTLDHALANLVLLRRELAATAMTTNQHGTTDWAAMTAGRGYTGGLSA